MFLFKNLYGLNAVIRFRHICLNAGNYYGSKSFSGKGMNL